MKHLFRSSVNGTKDFLRHRTKNVRSQLSRFSAYLLATSGYWL